MERVIAEKEDIETLTANKLLSKKVGFLGSVIYT